MYKPSKRAYIYHAQLIPPGDDMACAMIRVTEETFRNTNGSDQEREFVIFRVYCSDGNAENDMLRVTDADFGNAYCRGATQQHRLRRAVAREVRVG